MRKLKKRLLLIVVAIVLFNAFILSNVPNKANAIKEQIAAIQAEIKFQEEHMEEIITNIITYVGKYDKEKADMLMRVLNARGIKTDALIEHIINLIEGVADNYPELENSDDYKNMMNSLLMTQELIINTRNAYNVCVNQYNKYIEKFKQILTMFKHENVNYSMYEN